LIDSPL
jgi:hypothetical protein